MLGVSAATLSRLRQQLGFDVRLLPETLARAMSAGIGLFLAFIGYQASEGIGVVGGNGATLVSLGAAPQCLPVHLPVDYDDAVAAFCCPEYKLHTLQDCMDHPWIGHIFLIRSGRQLIRQSARSVFSEPCSQPATCSWSIARLCFSLPSSSHTFCVAVTACCYLYFEAQAAQFAALLGSFKNEKI